MFSIKWRHTSCIWLNTSMISSPHMAKPHLSKYRCRLSLITSRGRTWQTSSLTHSIAQITVRRKFATCTKLYKNEALSSGESDQSLFHLRYVFVKACEDQWEDVPEGVTFDLAYVDTHPGESYDPTKPVLVGVHGAPGSHKDFVSVLEPFAAKGYRVIIPNFPGYSYTRGVAPGHDDCFRQSPQEKAELLSNFLTELGIPRMQENKLFFLGVTNLCLPVKQFPKEEMFSQASTVLDIPHLKNVELMVSHSAGSYPLIHLCAQSNSIRSTMLICPAGHLIYRRIRPFFLLKALTNLWDKPMLRPYIKAFIWLGSIPTGFWKIPAAHMAQSCRSVTNVDFEHAGSCYVTMEMKKVPCCVVFTDNDPHIELSVYEQINSLLGITDIRISTYEQDGSYHPVQGVDGSPKAILLRQGGHNPMKKYKDVIADELQKLLQQIWKGKL